MAVEWNERNRMIATGVVGAVVNIVLGCFLYVASDTYAAKSTDLGNLKKQEKGLEESVKDGPMKQIELEKKRIEYDTLQGRLPTEEGLTKLIDSVSQLAARFKVDRKSVQFSPGDPQAATDPSYVRDTWHTRWEADFFSWCAFMNEMEERFPRFVSFENLTMTIKNSGMIPTGTRHDFTVDIVTYRYVKPQ